MKRGLLLLVLLGVAFSPVLAQEYRGNLYITAKNEQGQPLQGALVQVKGQTYTRQLQTGADGVARFVRLEPGAYDVTVSLEGYNTHTETGVQVDTLANIELTITLKQAEIVEEVVVTAQTPLLDRRKTGTSTVLKNAEITQIPTARDPWAVLSTIPSIQTDRVNVGGNESGQQAIFVGKGDNGDGASWVMDGVEFTDMAAIGASSTYFDFNSFQEIGFVTGGADPEQIAPGMRLNFATKQGSNRHTGSIRLFLADEDFQADPETLTNPPWMGSTPVQQNRVNEIFEKNFELGGPVAKDIAWYWFGFNQNDIDIGVPQAGGLIQPDRTKLRNTTIKFNGTIGGHTDWKAFYTRGDKIKQGRNAGPSRPPETTWNQSGPTPIYTGDIAHFFNPNFELSLQLSHVGGGFQLIPQGSADQIRFDSSFVWHDTFISYKTDRPIDQVALRGSYFLNAGNVDHEFKFGYKFKDAEVQSFTRYGNDGVIAFTYNYTYYPGYGDIGYGYAYIYREGTAKEKMEYNTLWVSDTILVGNWTFNASATWIGQDSEQLASFSPATGITCGGLPCVPALNFTGRDPGIDWSDVLPRVGFTYTFDLPKRLLIRGSAGRYVDQLSAGPVAFDHQAGVAGLTFFWVDFDGDHLVDDGEFDPSAPIATRNFDPFDPTRRIHRIDPDLDAPRVDEAILGVEYELMRDFTLGLNLTWRERDRELWSPLRDISAASEFVPLSPSDYEVYRVECGPVSGIPASALPPYCVVGYGLTDEAIFGDGESPPKTDFTRSSVLLNRPGYTQEFKGLELVATKRLSNRWMLRGYFSWNDWTQDFDGTVPTCGGGDPSECVIGETPVGDAPGVSDPTNFRGGALEDGGDVAVQSGGSGNKGDVFLGTARWQFNVNGLVQLPKNWTISGNLFGREGYGIAYFDRTNILEPDPVLPFLFTPKNVQIREVTSVRYDDVFNFDLKVAKLLKLQGGTTVELAIEGFNVLDDDTILQLEGRADRTSTFNRIDEVLSPRIYRLSATIVF